MVDGFHAKFGQTIWTLAADRQQTETHMTFQRTILGIHVTVSHCDLLPKEVQGNTNNMQH